MTVISPFIEPRRDDPRLNVDRRYKMLIGGKSVDAETGETIERQSPAYEGRIVSTIPKGSRRDAETAIAAARRAFDTGPWPKMSGTERSKFIARIGELLFEHREELATIECLEVGKTITHARNEMNASADLWAFAAGQAHSLSGETHNALGAAGLGLMLREPVGVVGIVTPWNFPVLIASERVPWALGAGCTVVLKPSEFTSGSSIRLAELARDAGLPDGVFNIITGYGDPVGQTLAEDSGTDLLSFTGSYRVGQVVGGLAAARIKRVGLELGGKGPHIVYGDADLPAAADGVARLLLGSAGEACIAGTRLLVERRAHDEMVDRLTDIARKVSVGDPLGDGTHMGALIHRPHLEKVERYVGEGVRDGAELVFGGARMGNSGSYYAPTMFTGVRPEMSIFRDEIFGPVLAVTPFDTADEAIGLANDSIYGLSASVWSTDLSKAIQTIRNVRAGRCWINGGGQGNPAMGISGFKQSGIGHELGRAGFDEYSRMKSVYVVLESSKPWV